MSVTSSSCWIGTDRSSRARSHRSTSSSFCASSNQKFPRFCISLGSEKISFALGKFWIVAKGLSLSRIRNRAPVSCRARPAPIPAGPAPTTMTSRTGDSGEGIPVLPIMSRATLMMGASARSPTT
jgi:hypothetical protein